MDWPRDSIEWGTCAESPYIYFSWNPLESRMQHNHLRLRAWESIAQFAFCILLNSGLLRSNRIQISHSPTLIVVELIVRSVVFSSRSSAYLLFHVVVVPTTIFVSFSFYILLPSSSFVYTRPPMRSLLDSQFSYIL